MGIWTRKTVASLQENDDASPRGLVRTLGPVDLIFMGIGVVIGAGLFSITGIAAAEHAGPAIVISFVIGAIGCLFAGLCYSELASMVPVCGSAYTYAFMTMGELIAWMIGWDLVLEYAIGAAAVSISWSGYVVSLLHDFNIHLPAEWIASPWQAVRLADGTMEFGYINLPALFIVVLTSCILILGIRESAFVNGLIVIIKLSVVVVFIGVGVFYINPENYTPFIPPNTGEFGSFGWSGILRAAGVVFFAYVGFDAVSTAAQEAKHPQRTIPIGILGSLAICTVIYVLFSGVMTGLANYKELDVAAPVAVAIGKTPFWWLNWLVKLAILAGFTSVILVLLLGQSRIFYSMACDGLLPSVFSEIHPRFFTPWRSNLILMLFVGLFAAFAPIALVGNMTSIGTLLAFVVVCIAVLILRYREPNRLRVFRAPWVPFTPVMGILVCGLLMVSLDGDTWIRLVVWLVLGLVLYGTYGRHHSKQSATIH